MNVILIYGTYSSGTLSVAEIIQESLSSDEISVEIVRNDMVTADQINAADTVIMGSPSWKVFGKQGMPHEQYYPMMEQLKGSVDAKPYAVYALGDSSYALVCGAADHLQQFVIDLGGSELIEPLKVEGFYFAQEERTNEIIAWVNALKDAYRKSGLI